MIRNHDIAAADVVNGLGHLLQDMRYAVRRLLADSRLTITAVMTLSLGVGSAVVMMDMLDRLLIRPPTDVRDPDRVTRLYTDTGSGFITVTDYRTVDELERELGAELEHIAAYEARSLSLGRGAEAEPIEVIAHGPRYFDVLGTRPQLGSLAAATPDAPQHAVISDSLWRRRFGGAPGVIGEPLRLGSDVYTISAVLPRGFAGVDYTAADIWVPLTVNPSSGDIPFLNVIARLRPDVDRRAASLHATAVYGASHPRALTLVFGDLSRSPEMTETTRVAIWIGGISLVVLLIACGNVANLLYVRGLRRSRELPIKVALGASRGRLMRDILIEATLLAAVAAIVAFAMVVTAGTVVRQLFLPTVAALVSPLDARLILLTVAVCLGATLLFGLLPALRLTTTRMRTPAEGTPPPSRLLDVFTAAQVALSVPLLVGAGLFVLSLLNAANQNFGFDARRVVVVKTSLTEDGRPREDAAVHRAMQRELSALPEVEAAAVVQQEPWRDNFSGRLMSVPGRELRQFFPMNPVDPAFFQMMGLRLVEGRFFTEAENRERARQVAVVSEAMARAIWPGESPLGQCLLIAELDLQAERPCTEIIGVVSDARWSPLIRPTGSRQPIFFVPIDQRPDLWAFRRAILVQAVRDPEALVPLLRARIDASGRPLPYVEIRLFDETFQPLLRPWRLGATVLIVFSLLALIIAAVGLIVVTSDAVIRRARELAVRTACGAEPSQLVRLVLSRSIGAILAGLVVGAGAAYAGARMLSALLFDVAPAEPRVFGAALVLLVGCALFAAWLSARRAASLDAVIALRAE